MWGEVEISDGMAAIYSAGACRTYVLRNGDEWLIAVDYEDGEDQEVVDGWRVGEGELLEGKSWKRYLASPNLSLSLLPALPDRAVVIRPDAPISVLPRESGTFYVSIPVWLNFIVGPANRRYGMAEIPSVILSNTWFGDPAAGELCYSLDAPLLRVHDTVHGCFEGPHLGLCLLGDGSQPRFQTIASVGDVRLDL